MTTRFRTRAFLISFIPFAVLLALSFWSIQDLVQSTVRDGLRNSLRENQLAIAHIHAKVDLQNSRFLNVAGENPALKAGMQLLQSSTDREAARRTVEDQLRELGEHMGFDVLIVAGPDGTPLAGVARQAEAASPQGETGSLQADARSQQPSQLVPLPPAQLGRINSGLVLLNGRTFHVAAVPVDENDVNIGSLSLGEYFDFSEFTTPAVLTHDGKVIDSNIPDIPFDELNTALASCSDKAECDLRLRGSNWISMPVQSYGGGYLLRSLENVDKALAPIQTRLHNLFLLLALICFLMALVTSIISSRSTVEPLSLLVSHLRKAVSTGVLPEFEGKSSTILEIQELAENYNRAAFSVREAGKKLEAAYLEFIGSLASALDARDRYTSGHSKRVSELSCTIAAAMELPPADLERIRIGALLHDIGKIGISDSVLQKPGRLTEEEFALVKQHPVIGRRILEGVHGFAPFLPAVELHHENWDGSGYPRGESGEKTPIDARIIHVADAYDAMTTDRSYRHGMAPERAVQIIVQYAGIQFDPKIVDIFTRLPREVLARHTAISEMLKEAAAREMAAAG
jgi:HD-GYP domain-containing protein (c-di-GMP phosphodiesterase class II)